METNELGIVTESDTKLLSNKQWKRVPFDIELAKDIQSGKVEGRIVHLNAEVFILDYQSCEYESYPIRFAYVCKDEIDYCAPEYLTIELPEETPKHEFKPFDKVLVRNEVFSVWRPDLYSYFNEYDDKNTYRCIGGVWKQCIPYEGNEHLVGTTDKPKED